jgi:hypothetical protein
MRFKKTLLTLCGCIVAVSSCMDARPDVNSSVSAKSVDDGNASCGGFTSVADCERIRRAIDRLKHMEGYESCKQAGAIADALFNSHDPNIGFFSDAIYTARYGAPWPPPRNGGIVAAGVPQDSVPPGDPPTPSGETRIENRIYVNRAYLLAYNSDALDAANIAHEIQHYLGNDSRAHTTGQAYGIGDSCNR